MRWWTAASSTLGLSAAAGKSAAVRTYTCPSAAALTRCAACGPRRAWPTDTRRVERATTTFRPNWRQVRAGQPSTISTSADRAAQYDLHVTCVQWRVGVIALLFVLWGILTLGYGVYVYTRPSPEVRRRLADQYATFRDPVRPLHHGMFVLLPGGVGLVAFGLAAGSDVLAPALTGTFMGMALMAFVVAAWWLWFPPRWVKPKWLREEEANDFPIRRTTAPSDLGISLWPKGRFAWVLATVVLALLVAILAPPWRAAAP